jgi:hypothetical protein
MMASGNANQIFINQSILATEMVMSVKFSFFSLKNIKLVSCDKSSME